MKKILIMLVFTVMTLMMLCMPITASAATYSETVVTGLGSGYFMTWGTFGEGMCAFSDGEKYGYVDSAGKVAIGCKFSLNDYAFASSEFSEGVARTVINDKICFIDKTGKTVLATKYNYSANANQYSGSDTTSWGIAAFHEGRACIVGDNGKWGFIDKAGIPVTAFEFTNGAKFENGKAYVHFVSGDNLIDLNGKKLLPQDYGRIDEQEDGSWYCYDLTYHPEIEVGTFSGTAYDTNSYDIYDANLNFVKNVAVNKKYERPTAIDFSRTLNQYGLDTNRYSYAYDVGHGLVLAEVEVPDSDGNFKTFVDTATKKEFNIPLFLTAEEFNDEGICVIGRRSPVSNVVYTKIGAVDTKGNLLVPFNYLGSSWAKEFNDGLLLAQRASDNKLVVVKLTGAGSSAVVQSVAYNAKPSVTKIITGSEVTRVNAYNIGGNNFYRIRDLQFVCASTDFAFTAEWNAEKKAVELKTAASNGNDSISAETLQPKNAVPSSATIYKDGEQLKLTAYNIDGYTYFKLRDVGSLFGFEPIWNQSDSSITLKAIREE